MAGVAAAVVDGPVSVPWHPLLVEVQPHLDKISREELFLLLGGLILPAILLWWFLHAVSVPAYRHHLRSFTVVWLLTCAVIHCFLELHFVFWREGWIAQGIDLYAAADFRYGRPLEAGTAAMELITAVVVGPLCLLLAYAIVTDKAWRYPLQMCVCSAQIYGLSWFTLQPIFYHLPVASEDPFLFWVIFVGMNAPWAIFPPILLYKAWTAVTRQFRQKADQNEKAQQQNGKKIN